jgi:tripartite-type tricarboxylate transporter receptor subunit TctC
MALSAPPGTPEEIAKKVSDAIGQGFRQPEMHARILKLEAEPLGGTPAEMRKMIEQSLKTWAPVVEAAKISID